MTFVVPVVNTDVVRQRGSITNVVDVHERLVALLRYLLATPDDDGARRSQQTIADATAGFVSQSAISTYISGTRRAKIDTALAIARAHGIRDAYFTDEGVVEPGAYRRGGERLERDDDRSIYPAVEEYLSPEAAAERPPVSDAHAAELRRIRFAGDVTVGMVGALHRELINRDRGRTRDLTSTMPEGARALRPGKLKIGTGKKR